MNGEIAERGQLPAALAGFAQKLRWLEAEHEDCAASPLDPALLDRFHATKASCRRAACSLWGQTYFNALLIPTVCVLAAGMREAAVARRIAPIFCRATGELTKFLVLCEAVSAPPREREADFIRLVEAHLESAVEDLARIGGLSSKMLWESADLTSRWAAMQIAKGEATLKRRLQTIAQETAAESRMARTWRAGLSANASGQSPRRFCCLRYRLAGFAPCQGLCPRL